MKRMKRDISTVINEAIAQAQTPCVSVLLQQGGEEVLFEMGGFANIGENKPIARNTIYRLYSLTKPMTAVAALTLMESGKMDIMTPVYEYLEGFRDQQVIDKDGQPQPVKRAVQIRDLFTMTSGLPYPGLGTPAERAMQALYDQMKAEAAEGLTLSTVGAANRMGQNPLAHQPGEQWMYGTSADVLGTVIEVISGKPLNEYMREVIFEPLGMCDTDFFVAEDKRERLATLHERNNGGLRVHPESELRHGVFSLPNVLEGGAGIYSTIDDVMTFGQMLLGGGKLKKEHILSHNAVAWMSENHLTPQQMQYLDWDSVRGYGYGGLVRVLLSPGQSFSLGVKGEFGWDGWTGPYLSVCPEKDMVIVVMQQLADCGTNAVTRRLRNVIYANI